MLEIKGLRTEFIRYLEANYEYARPGVMASTVLFAYYHDIGMPLEAIFRDKPSMEEARKLLAVHFEKVGRKDPEGHAAVCHGCWVKFREFLEATDRLALLETAES